MINERLRGQHPAAFGHPTDLLLALFRRQTGPVHIHLEAFELLIPPGLVLGPSPSHKRSESLLRGESGPGVVFCQVIGKNAGEYTQQGVKSPATVYVRAEWARGTNADLESKTGIY